MKHIKLHTRVKKILADTVTPVSIYLKLRDKYRNTIMLESSDYHGDEDAFSYVCCDPIASFTLDKGKVTRQWPDGTQDESTPTDRQQVAQLLSEFATSFEVEEQEYKFINSGLFGYMGYDAVEYYEDINLDENDQYEYNIPEIRYHVYRNIIVIDHFKNELYVFEHSHEPIVDDSGINYAVTLINSKNVPSYTFGLEGEETSNFTDPEFLEVIDKGIQHCNRGDVFQIVLSRRFRHHFKGDEFNVYRALRSINPSPYLFYFDYGTYKLMGSSPEAQIVIKGKEASIYPIAGTFRRTGNDHKDAELARKLYDDPKENSEHVMLVDLARNDLSRNGDEVKVQTFKEIQYYSHVIHLVSHVTGQISEGMSNFRMVADTFPAGTLSGAPKHMAMTLINRYENVRRGYYGGAIGYLGFNGDFNHAIMIRSLLSTNNTLYYQAGAGVVAKSIRESELQEVHNKLAALRNAIEIAQTLNA